MTVQVGDRCKLKDGRECIVLRVRKGNYVVVTLEDQSWEIVALDELMAAPPRRKRGRPKKSQS